MFTAFAVLFFKNWRLLCFDLRYSCQDTGKDIYLAALYLGLQHFPFYFYNIGGYFALIGGTVTKIRAKTFIQRF